MKRKYQYATRQAAEDAARNRGKERDDISLGLQAMIAGSVQWLPRKYAKEAYRLGVIQRYAGTWYLVVHWPPEQQPYAVVWDECRLQDEINHFAQVLPCDDEARDYRQGLCDLRQLGTTTAI